MALLTDDLSVWEIGFRWAGYDPDNLYLRIPLAVRDNFRTLIHEIHHAHLDCDTLNMHKYHGDDPEEAKFYIRYWLNAVEDCSNGKRYDKTLLKWAGINRQDLQEWCERHKVPLPSFWFPPGWGVEYEWPDDTPEEEIQQSPGESVEERKTRIDQRHRTKMACQQIALYFWAKNPKSTIKEISGKHEIMELAGGKEYEIVTIEEWLGEVDPRDSSKKRGPKRKNNSGPGNSDQSQ